MYPLLDHPSLMRPQLHHANVVDLSNNDCLLSVHQVRIKDYHQAIFLSWILPVMVTVNSKHAYPNFKIAVLDLLQPKTQQVWRLNWWITSLIMLTIWLLAWWLGSIWPCFMHWILQVSWELENILEMHELQHWKIMSVGWELPNTKNACTATQQKFIWSQMCIYWILQCLS